MDAAEKALLSKILEGLSTSEQDEAASKKEELYLSHPEEYLNKLKKRAKDINEPIELSIGDIVIWKEGLKNKRLPNYGQPCIILQKFDPPLVDDDATYSEKLNIQLGFITENDDFFSFNYDSSRFKLYK